MAVLVHIYTRDEKHKAPYQKVEKLKELISEGVSESYKIKVEEHERLLNLLKLQRESGLMRKHSRQTEDLVETDTVSPMRSMRNIAGRQRISWKRTWYHLILAYITNQQRKLSWLLNHNVLKQLTRDQVTLLVVHFNLLANT
ncbi:unnamed protein product [Eruca vesicaria subsp. sativa]|uniref:Uncharacterized protein n=1 Tax=Eruca vesicaria subsp. sativa TaxID=29727 RepID=A0ABC8LTI6_ERUVS|nr:unnamed protein product [Eruca vesicaria subsp. sativa]